MSRFKFACNCGKRLAAYDWMVGRLLSCPKCGRTLTVPTPFKAEDQLKKMIETGYTPEKRQIGKPVRKPNWPKRIGILAGAIAVGAALACAVLYFLNR